MKNRIIKFTAMCLILFLPIAACAQTGGGFALTQTVIANGGGQNSAGTFALDGTTGQTVAGNALTGAPFAVTSGFWNFTALPPTAAQVSVGGRVITANGQGIRSARVTLTAPNGETRVAVTGSFGYYRFEQVPVGEIYVISVSAKRFTFSQPTVVRTVYEEIADADFVADTSIP